MNGISDAVVVGGGAAGLMAACELQRAGREVVLLEAGERVGGRLHTVHPLGLELPIELGAEFLHGDAPITRALLDELRLRYIEGEGSAVSARGGIIQRDDDRFERVGQLLMLIETDGADVSLSEWLAREPGGAELAEARVLARRFVEGFHAADAERVSTHALAGGGESGAVERSARVVAGHRALAGAMAEELGSAIRLDTRVQRMEWRPGHCRIEAVSAAGAPLRFEARRVVVTVSIGVLQHGSLVIEPLPPQIAAALRHLAMGDVVRLPFIFRERFWDDARITRVAGGAPGFIHTPESAFNVWWTQHPVSAPVLVAWSGGPAAQQLLRLSAAERTHLALTDLGRALGLPRSDLERRVLHAELHDWSADPLVRGAYSYPLVGGALAWRQLAEVHEHTLAFAGEAVAAEQGTVEAALASGRRAALALLNGAD